MRSCLPSKSGSYLVLHKAATPTRWLGSLHTAQPIYTAPLRALLSVRLRPQINMHVVAPAQGGYITLLRNNQGRASVYPRLDSGLKISTVIN